MVGGGGVEEGEEEEGKQAKISYPPARSTSSSAGRTRRCGAGASPCAEEGGGARGTAPAPGRALREEIEREQHRIHELREERKRQEHREREEQRLLQAEDESDGWIVRRTEWIVVLDQRGQYLNW